LLQNCSMVMTDSGGLQKEAFFFKKPCITLRDETEWVELIENKVNHLCHVANEGEIFSLFEKVKGEEVDFEINLYGKGDTSELIVKDLLERKSN
jgi:UDP-GlcNAc3NAcA epimerase